MRPHHHMFRPTRSPSPLRSIDHENGAPFLNHPRAIAMSDQNTICSSNNRSGFALVLALVLMSFIMLLMVSFSTLLMVEVQLSTHLTIKTEAQQNALLGANIALGELQRTLGPDRRVSAPADLSYSNSPGTGHWVGVYGNPQNIDYSVYPPAGASGVQPILLTWLVSGNQNVNFQQNLQGSITGGPSSIPFEPAGTTNISLSNIQTSSTNLTYENHPARVLVGRGSTGAGSSNESIVIAPLIDIDPDNPNQGGYAYWVGDEGTKARANLTLPLGDMDLEEQQLAIQVPWRTGLESMSIDWSGNNPLGTYSFDNPELQRVLSRSQMPMISMDQGEADALEQLAQNRFHDLTTHTYSLLTDTYAGGLKKNLTAALSPEAVIPSDDTPLFPTDPSFGIDPYIPNWGQLRNYLNDTPATLDTPMPWVMHDSEHLGRAPVVLYSNLGFDFYIEPTEANPDEGEIILKMFIFAILWNPYNVTLEGNDYELGMLFHNNNQQGGTLNFRLEGSTVYSIHLNQGLTGTSDTSFSFPLEAPDMAPGTAYGFVFRPDQLHTEYIRGTNSLVSQTPFDATNYLLYRTGVFIDITNPNQEIEVIMANSPARANLDINLTDSNAWLAGNVEPNDAYHRIREVQLAYDLHPGSPRTLYEAEPINGLIHDDPDATGTDPTMTFYVHHPWNMRGLQTSNYAGWLGYRFFQHRLGIDSNPATPLSIRSTPERQKPAGNFSYGGRTAKKGSLAPTGSGIGGYWLGYFNISSSSNTFLGTQGDLRRGNRPYIFHDVTLTEQPLLSVGQLQSLPLALVDLYPNMHLGNSQPSIRVERDRHTASSGLTRLPDPSNLTNINAYPYYDLPWHLNHAFWDRFFLTSIPGNWTQQELDDRLPLPNRRLIYNPDKASITLTEVAGPGADAYHEAAENFLVEGGFNVNSTSVQAWRALLTSASGIPSPEDPNDILQAAFPRFINLVGRWKHPATGETVVAFFGNRELAMRATTDTNEDVRTRLDALIDSLAQAIVAEIRQRGPFLSLADFVNRRLDSGERGTNGVLQAAIDATALSASPVNNMSDSIYGTDFTTLTPNWPENRPATGTYMMEHLDNQRAYVASNQYLRQSDILASLGPVLTVRSDTFRIRSYGESKHPITGAVTGRAWCEVVVQRVPDYLDSSEPASSPPDELTLEINQRFGRKFRIIEFRWLNEDEV